MKRILVAASLATACALSAPAFAQSDPAAPKPAPVPMSPDTGTTASVKNFGSVISAIQAGKTNVDQLKAMTSVSTVTVVKVDDLAKGENQAALDNALTKNKDQVTELQAALDANAALKAKLTEQQVESSDVIAAKIEADGSVTVYVHDSAT